MTVQPARSLHSESRYLLDDVALLLSTPLFSDLDAAKRSDLLDEIEHVYLSGGDVLVRQGERGDALYVVVHGRLRAYVNENGRERAIGDVTRGQPVGEVAMFTEGLRTATVRAARDSHLIRLSRTAFDRLIDRHPPTMMQVVRRIVQRTLSSATARKAPALTSIAIAPAQYGSPAAPVARALAAALSELGPTLLLDAAAVDSELGAAASETPRDGTGNRRLVAWLAQVEESHRFVVYLTDATATAWTHRCLRQTDRVMLVGGDGDAPESGVIDEAIAEASRTMSLRVDLVRAHGSDAAPTGTGAWLAARRVQGHHHVRIDRNADFARLARALSGRSVGLVLSGGGARGFAHIGVIRAMRELGLPIDYIGGTSAGSVIAALHASGRDHEAMLADCRRAFIDNHMLTPSKDYTLPLVSLVSGRRATREINRLFDPLQIEDLPIPYFAVSANLTRAEIVAHDRGPLARGVRASCSVPGVAPPMFDGGDLLVDGGVLANLPAETMRARCPGPIVAVDVCERVDLSTDSPYRETLSDWALLAQKLGLSRTPRHSIPGITAILTRTAMLSSIYQQASVAKIVDRYLHPPVDSFGGFEWTALERLAETGYRDAMVQLAGWTPGEAQ